MEMKKGIVLSLFLLALGGWGCAPSGDSLTSSQKSSTLSSPSPTTGGSSGTVTSPTPPPATTGPALSGPVSETPAAPTVSYDTVDIFHYWSGVDSDGGLRGDRYFTNSTSPGQSIYGTNYERSDPAYEFKLFQSSAEGRSAVYDCFVNSMPDGTRFNSGNAERGDHYLGVDGCGADLQMNRIGYIYRAPHQNQSLGIYFLSELHQCRNPWSRILDRAATKNKSNLTNAAGLAFDPNTCVILGYVP